MIATSAKEDALRSSVFLYLILKCFGVVGVGTPRAALPSGLRPIFNIEPGDLAEVAEIPAQQGRICNQRDTGNSQVHGGKAPTFELQLRKADLRLGRKGEHVHLQEPAITL